MTCLSLVSAYEYRVGGGDFVAILSYKSGTTENYGVNRNIKW